MPSWLTAIAVGPSPTFRNDDNRRRLEAHLLDFSGDLLGQRLTVAFERFLRPQERFAREGDLIAQIARDLEVTRALGVPAARG